MAENEGHMSHDDHAAGTAQDPAAIERLANDVPGVQEAVALVDRRLRPAGRRARRPDSSFSSGPSTPLRTEGRALSIGPEQCSSDDLPKKPSTLIEALYRAAEEAPERGITYVLPDGTTDRQTYAELLDDGLRLLAGLRDIGLAEGDPVLLQCADNRTFLTAFWACLLGGFLPTPVGVAPSTRSSAATGRLYAAWRLLDRPPVLADDESLDRVLALEADWEEGEDLRAFSVRGLTKEDPAEPATVHPDRLVLNLLTSGSTGVPKCVQHPSRTLLARSHATVLANGFTEHEVSLNWMPLDHVGGLVMYHLRDVVLRCEQISAPTESFVRRPLNWLDWIDRFGVTNTWAPNFAFALVTKLGAEIGAGRWDLSSLSHICNGGEPVTVATAHRFLDLLEPHGLPADAMVPSWGMSETSSGVTFSRLDGRDRSVGTVTLDPRSLDGPLRTLPHGTAGALTLTDLGPPIAGVRLRVVDPEGEILPEGRVGRLQIGGSTLMRGYFGNPEANRESLLPDGWFDTGDLGFLHEGRLVLTGRTKDMVIVNGANYPAHDVEAAVERAPGVRPALAAACGVHDEDAGTDTVVVFFVPADETAGELDAVVTAVRESLAQDLGLSPKYVVPVTEAEFPRAAGGKIQRKRLLEDLREGRFAGRLYGGVPDGSTSEGDWHLEPVWTPARVSGAPHGRPTLLYSPDSGPEGRALARAFGDDVSTVTVAESFQTGGPERVGVRPLSAVDHERALEHLAPRLGTSPHVVLAWDFGRPRPDTDPTEPATRLMTVLAALTRRLPEAEVTVVTSGAAAAGPEEVEPSRAALTGLVRTAAAENMFAAVRLVDIPADTAPEEVARFAEARHDAEVMCVRGGEPLAARLRLVPQSVRLGVPEEFLKPGGTVLLTGGLGGVGRELAEYLLVSMGARLLLVGRTPEARLGDRGTVLAGLRELGDTRYATADVADPKALADAVEAAEAEWGRPLDLVVHLAAAPVAAQWSELSRHELARETRTWLRRQLAPKLTGGAAIEGLLERRPDTAVVLFSSVNGYFGGSAFGAYSAANAALDGYAHRWAARGHEVRCIGWSMWSGTGMNEGSPLTAAARRRGFRLIEPSHGLEAFLAALNQPQRHLLIGADPENAHVKEHLAPEEFADGSTLVAVVAEESAEAETVRRRVAETLASAGALAQVTLVPRIVRDSAGAVDHAEILAARAGRSSGFSAPRGEAESAVANIFDTLLEAGAVGRDDSFFGLGGDSIRAIQVTGALSERWGREVPVRLLYEHPTVRELAAALGGE